MTSERRELLLTRLRAVPVPGWLRRPLARLLRAAARLPLGARWQRAVILDSIYARAGTYPTDLLAGCDSALLLFGAAFLGINDAIHFAAAGLAEVTVVDIDAERLDAMRALYPRSWELVAADAFDFVQRRHAAGERYDIVSADPTTPLMPRCRDELPILCALARRAVVLGIEPGLEFDPPQGWRSRRVGRSKLADWMVLEAA